MFQNRPVPRPFVCAIAGLLLVSACSTTPDSASTSPLAADQQVAEVVSAPSTPLEIGDADNATAPTDGSASTVTPELPVPTEPVDALLSIDAPVEVEPVPTVPAPNPERPVLVDPVEPPVLVQATDGVQAGEFTAAVVPNLGVGVAQAVPPCSRNEGPPSVPALGSSVQFDRSGNNVVDVLISVKITDQWILTAWIDGYDQSSDLPLGINPDWSPEPMGVVTIGDHDVVLVKFGSTDHSYSYLYGYSIDPDGCLVADPLFELWHGERDGVSHGLNCDGSSVFYTTVAAAVPRPFGDHLVRSFQIASDGTLAAPAETLGFANQWDWILFKGSIQCPFSESGYVG